MPPSLPSSPPVPSTFPFYPLPPSDVLIVVSARHGLMAKNPFDGATGRDLNILSRSGAELMPQGFVSLPVSTNYGSQRYFGSVKNTQWRSPTRLSGENKPSRCFPPFPAGKEQRRDPM